MSESAREEYGTAKKLLSGPVIPLGYLRRRLRGLNSFKADKRGSTQALANTIKAMIDAEELRQLPPAQAKLEYGTTSPLYVIGPNW
jgi:hypothetical protein